MKDLVLLRERTCSRHNGMEEIDPLQHCRLAMLRQEGPTGRMQNKRAAKEKVII